MKYPIEVPHLEHDAMMARMFPGRGYETLRYRQRVERFIVAALCAHMAEAGWQPSFVDDGEELAAVSTAKEAMELAFAVDECRVFFDKGDLGEDARHVVLFIWDNGEDGMTCISDWGYTDGDADGFNAAMEAFDAEKAVELQRDGRVL